MVTVNLKFWTVVQSRHVDTNSCINRFYVIVWPIINYNNSLWSLFTSENYYSNTTMTYKVIIHFICRQRIGRLPLDKVCVAMRQSSAPSSYFGGVVIPMDITPCMERYWLHTRSKTMLNIHVTKHWHIMHYFEINRAAKATNYTGKII